MKLIDRHESSVENVLKFVFEDPGGSVLEVSHIRKNDCKDILVVPTQTSCRMGCQFCHLTGLNVPTVNLSAEQITELVTDSLKISPPENPTLLISYMGAGEPLMNVSNVMESAQQISKLPGYSRIRFGVSTLIPGIKPIEEFTDKVVKSGLDFKLHWSLHSVRENTRRTLMPSALNLKDGATAVTRYHNTTDHSVEIHYTLIDGINDTPADVEGLAGLVDKRFTIKLLRFAPYERAAGLTESKRGDQFKAELERVGFTVEMYSPPGRDIGAACGMFLLDQYSK